MVSWNWPADFPDDCPPEDAVPAGGVYYRIVKNDPPQSSVYEDRDDAIKCALKFDSLGTHIAAADLTPDSGKILKTPGLFPSHHTWWIADGFDATALSASVDSL